MSNGTVLKWHRQEEDSSPLPRRKFRLGAFQIEPKALMVRNGVRSEHIERKAMEVLVCLARHSPEPVTREQLFDDVWQGAYVSGGVLNRVVSVLRKVLGDDPTTPQYIETIPRVGYRLLQPAQWEDAPKTSLGLPGEKRPSFAVVGLGLAIALVAALVGAFMLDGPRPQAATLSPSPVTSDPGWEDHPAIAVDDQWLAYSHRGSGSDGIYVSHLKGGTGRHLLASAGDGWSTTLPAWSPDSSALAWVESGGDGCRIRLQEVISSDPVRSFPCGELTSLDWSPDGSRLLFDDIDEASNRLLYQLDIESSERVPLLAPPRDHWDSSARYSPGGTRIALVRTQVGIRSFLVMTDLDGEELLQYEPPMGFVESLDWLDEDTLVLGIEGGYGVSELWLFHVSAVRLERLEGTLNAWKPAVGRDRVAYSKMDFKTGIWVVNVRGQRTPVIRSESTRIDVHPQLSPNGADVAFISNRTGSPQVWLSSDGGAESVVTDLDCYWLGPPRWNPDGSELLFEGRSNGSYRVYRLIVATRTVQQLAVPFDDHREPVWGPGETILLSAPEGETWQLWEWSPSGEWRQVTTDGAFVGQFDPQTNWVYFTKFNQPGLWRKRVGGDRGELVVDWLEYADRRNWAVANDSVVAVRRRASVQELVRITDDATEVLADVGDVRIIGVSAVADKVVYGVIDAAGSDIYSATLGGKKSRS